MGMMKRIVFSLALAMSLTAAGVAGADAPAANVAAPATQPLLPATQPSAEVRRVVDGLLAKRDKLRLTDNDQSASKRFSFRFNIGGDNPDFPDLDALVQRDGDRTAIVMRGAGRDKVLRPWWYVNDGLFVEVDKERPGQVLVFEGTVPYFQFASKDDVLKGEMACAVDRARSVVADPESVLDTLLKKVAWAGYEPDKRLLTVQTVRNATVKIRLAERDDDYPIGYLTMEAKGIHIIFGQVELNEAAGRSWAALTLADVRKLGLPIRELTRDQFMRQTWVPPKDLGDAPDERNAVEKLERLVSADATTRPAK